MFSNILSGAAGFPVADLGDEISRSLRFPNTPTSTENAVLTRSTSSVSTWTVSVWVKHVSLYNGYIFSNNGSQGFRGGNSSSDSRPNYYIDSDHRYTAGEHNDFAAWYHYVITYDGSNLKIYVNGSLETTYSTGNGALTLSRIGGYNGSIAFAGYLAAFRFIDGTAVSDTNGVIDEFGRYQEDGVWVPKDYTGTYGTNGFHLDFADSSNPGNDVSGNNNDFTASGFDTGTVALYSANLVSSSGTWASGRTPTELFGDTSTSTMAQVGATGATMTFTPTTPISYQSLHYFNHGATWNLNSGTTGGSTGSAGWQEIDGNSGTLTSLQFLNSGGGAAAVGAIAINGTAAGNILVDNTDNDVDYLDTPTSNYATWNPLSALSANVTFSDANLRLGTIASQAWTPGYLTFGPFECGKPGKYYFEMHDDGGTGYKTCNFGVTDNLSMTWSDWWWNTGDTLSWYPETGSFYRNGGSAISIGSSSTSGGKAMAIDFENGTISAYSGGTLVGSLTGSSSNLTVGKKYYIVAATSNSNSTTMPFNFGQMPFAFTPPDGYKALQTNNLPEPTIKNGKKHFEAIIWTGDGNDNRDITTTESFKPDLVWIKRRGSTLDHGLFDSVRGGSKILYSNLGIAEDTSSVNIKQFNSNGFRLGTGAQVNASSQTYVAWCWKAGGTAVSNGNGSITSSVSANTAAGFSIVSYTGNSTLGATIGHGLSSPPELIFTKNRDTSADWAVYHVAQDATAPEDKYMALNTSDSTADAIDRWNDTAPTSSVFSVGDAIQTNGSNNMIAYCWHSVEGFSKFGSYTGNGNADGTLVYLGFKPALIILKSSSSAFDWQIYDSTRSTTNPALLTLRPNQDASEVTSGNDLDILSNGFKARDNGSINNNNNSTYLYMAWAEHPFGGENVPPVTAR